MRTCLSTLAKSTRERGRLLPANGRGTTNGGPHPSTQALAGPAPHDTSWRGTALQRLNPHSRFVLAARARWVDACNTALVQGRCCRYGMRDRTGGGNRLKDGARDGTRPSQGATSLLVFTPKGSSSRKGEGTSWSTEPLGKGPLTVVCVPKRNWGPPARLLHTQRSGLPCSHLHPAWWNASGRPSKGQGSEAADPERVEHSAPAAHPKRQRHTLKAITSDNYFLSCFCAFCEIAKFPRLFPDRHPAESGRD